jgi:hypothetical protein
MLRTGDIPPQQLVVRPVVALRVVVRRHNNSVALGAKRTFRQPQTTGFMSTRPSQIANSCSGEASETFTVATGATGPSSRL